MKTLTVLFLLICLPMPSVGNDDPRIEGAWLQDGMTWTKAPPDVNPRLETGAAVVMYFSDDQSFALIYCWLYREPRRYITISHGDGRGVYLGKWKAVGEDIDVEYRLVDRTVKIKGEELPGPIQHATIKVSQRVLHLEGKTFHRAGGLDKSATEVVAGLQHTSTTP